MANVIVKTQTSILDMVITPISKFTKAYSPDVIIHGIPWKIEAYKNEEKNSLAIFLQCAKKDKISTWTAAASAAIQLKCYSDEKNALEHHIEPYPFNASSLSFGCVSIIKWDELLKDENKYVQDDSIELKVEITAENPNYVDRSILKFESIDKSCDCSSIAFFRLTVTNIKNLLAVRSPQFIVRGLPWDLTVYKDRTSNIGTMMMLQKSSKSVSCKVKMSVKLLSSEDGVVPVGKSDEESLKKLEVLNMKSIISWNELLKPENGYIDNNSFTLEVKIKVDKPVGDAPNLDPNIAAKRGRFECSICLEDIDKQDVSATPCCHLFCTACITAAVRKSHVCPFCKEPVQLNDLRRMYLFASK